MESNLIKDKDLLLKSYQDNRLKIEKLVQSLEELSKKIDNLIPKEYTGRNRFIFEDRVKLITQLYDSILRYRSELGKLLEKEIQLVNEMYHLDDDDIVKDVSALPTEKVHELLQKLEGMMEKVKEMESSI